MRGKTRIRVLVFNHVLRSEWRKEMGVEPTQDRMTALTGFEGR